MSFSWKYLKTFSRY